MANESVLRFRVDARPALGSTNQLATASEKLSHAVNDANGKLRTANGSFVKTGQTATGAASATSGLTAKVGLLSAALKAIPFIGVAELTRRFIAGFAEADKAAAAVRTLGVDSEELRAKLLGVSNELGGLVSQTELTTAAYDVASAGFTDAGAAADILKAASLGAVGGMSDLGTVADATTSVLNAYGLSSDKAARIVDGFIQTQNDGKIIVAQYAAQIGRVAPIAAAAGVGIEELNAAISAVTATGVPVESTFAGLRQAVASVIKPTEEAKKTAELLGIEFSSAAIKAKGFGGFLEEVVNKTGGSEVALTRLFGSVEAVATILPLANDNLTKFNTSLDNQKNSAGAAETATEDLGSTVSAQASSIVKNIGNVARQLDEVLGPALKRILKGLNDIINAASTALAKLTDLTTGELERASASFVGFGSILFKSEGGLQKVKSAVEALNPAVAGSTAELDKMQGALNRASRAAQTVGPNAAPGFRKLAEETQGAIFKIQELIQARRKALEAGAGSTGGQETTEDPEVIALRARVEALLAAADADKGGGGSKGTRKTRTKKPQLTDLEKEEIRMNKLADRLEQQALNTQRQKAEAYESQFRSLDDQRALLEARLRGNVQEVEDAFALRDLIREHGEERGKILNNQRLQNRELEQEVANADKLKAKFREVGDIIKNGVGNAIKGAIDGTMSLAEAARGILDDLTSRLIDFAINAAFAGLGSGGGVLGMLFGGKRAEGGTVTGGRSFLVGERGPELFTPGRTGSITPNNALGGSNIVVNVDASGSSVEGDSDQAGQLGKMLGAAVQAELIKQKRPGGLLA